MVIPDERVQPQAACTWTTRLLFVVVLASSVLTAALGHSAKVLATV
jgi:hypothetical protein